MPGSPTLARDAALYRMRGINRWLIAGAVVVTGFLTDVAAQAFPGHKITRTGGSSSTPQAVPATTRRHHHRAGHHALTPPEQAPQPQVVEPVPGATAAPATSAAPAVPAPAPAPAPVQSAPAPAPAPAPVVSGGS